LHYVSNRTDQNGFVETDTLRRTSILRDGCPSGATGSCSFVCSHHRALIERWNNGAIGEADYIGRGREIANAQWEKFGSS